MFHSRPGMVCGCLRSGVWPTIWPKWSLKRAVCVVSSSQRHQKIEPSCLRPAEALETQSSTGSSFPLVLRSIQRCSRWLAKRPADSSVVAEMQEVSELADPEARLAPAGTVDGPDLAEQRAQRRMVAMHVGDDDSELVRFGPDARARMRVDITGE